MGSILFHIGILGIICLPEIITAAFIFLLAIFYSGIKALGILNNFAKTILGGF